MFALIACSPGAGGGTGSVPGAAVDGENSQTTGPLGAGSENKGNAAQPLPSGVVGPSADAITCKAWVVKTEAYEECLVSNETVKIRLKGYVVDKSKQFGQPSKNGPGNCVAPLNDPAMEENEPKTPCCQGQYVRFLDENHHKYVEGQINPDPNGDGDFDVTLTTKKGSTISGLLYNPGYAPSPSELDVTHTCGTSPLPSCKPTFSYMQLMGDLSGNSVDEGNLPACPKNPKIILEF
ncbi:MAG: hypothetical protein U1F57_08550 [bacterium]